MSIWGTVCRRALLAPFSDQTAHSRITFWTDTVRPSILIYNPASGRRLKDSAQQKLLDELKDGGFAVTPMPTQGPGDAVRLAREHAASGDIEVAFALGGDGTLREVATGLIGTDVALGVLPAGTANVLTFELGISRKPIRTARALKNADIRELDVGFAGDIPFLMMVSGGLDAQVMATQNSAMKQRFGPAAIAASGLRRFFRWKSPMIDLEIDGVRESVAFFSVCNIPFFGGPFRLAPDADAYDGALDLVTFATPGRAPLLGFVFSMLLGRHTKRKDVQNRRFQKLAIVGPLPWGLQMDGDVLPVELPCPVTVKQRALRVLVPRQA